MLIIIQKLEGKNRMKIKKENIINLLLFLVGVFCQINPIMSRGAMIVFLGLCLFLFILLINNKKIKFGIGFFWYFSFVIFCMFSLTYTINKINPDFVYIRIITYLILLFFAAPFFEKEESVKTITKGFLIGGLIGITVVLVNQYSLIGVRRLGGNLYGSYAEFGAVCTLAMTSFIWLQKEYKVGKIIKILVFLYLALAIILSGARKAMIIVILVPLFMQIFDKRKKIAKKFVILLALAIFSMVAIYLSLNNEYLYKFIGYRIESGIASVIGEKEEDASLYERSSFKDLAKEMFKEKPVLGWGMHGFAIKNYYEHGNSLYFLLYSHDGFLEILSCYGLIGFILYYWVFVYIIINYKKMLYDDTGIFLFSYIIIILLMELYSISFFNSFYILMIGASANIVSKRRRKDERNIENNIKICTRQNLFEN